MAKDPICGRAVEVRGASTPSAEYKKRHYVFCSEHCLNLFRQRAERFRMHELWRAGAMFSKGSVTWAMA